MTHWDSIPLRNFEIGNRYLLLMLRETCPHPPAPSPAGEGEKDFFLFPSPAGATLYTQVQITIKALQ